ncbi:unnamed protein product [Miscanthus lutarioriparius]|uniref:Uncharacterized protein n=1 Tax=Miscanthus lutarioriparius TaxID=422564 RepID=A0A811RXT8_9POAL|nr:unnamed protein product [Miscanthus lutarioriparius]
MGQSSVWLLHLIKYFGMPKHREYGLWRWQNSTKANAVGFNAGTRAHSKGSKKKKKKTASKLASCASLPAQGEREINPSPDGFALAVPVEGGGEEEEEEALSLPQGQSHLSVE